MFFHYLQDSIEFISVDPGILHESLDVSAENGEWRSQFMGDIGHEVATDLVDLFQLGNVVKKNGGPDYLPGVVASRYRAKLHDPDGAVRLLPDLNFIAVRLSGLKCFSR